jgi:hypothetical protein
LAKIWNMHPTAGNYCSSYHTSATTGYNKQSRIPNITVLRLHTLTNQLYTEKKCLGEKSKVQDWTNFKQMFIFIISISSDWITVQVFGFFWSWIY